MNNSVFIAMFLLLMGGVILLYAHKIEIKCLLKAFVIRFLNRGKGVKIAYSADVNIKVDAEGMCMFHPHSTFRGHIGIGSYVGPYSELSAYIGRFCSIAPFVRSNSGRHPYKEPFVTTSPCFFSLNPFKEQCGTTFAKEQMFVENRMSTKNENYPLWIGNEVWIGEGAFLAGGITVGDGAMILARAVVVQDVPPYAIVGGVPAKVISFRYDEDTINWLLDIQWWNLDTNWLKENWKLLCDIDKLKAYFKDHPIED